MMRKLFASLTHSEAQKRAALNHDETELFKVIGNQHKTELFKLQNTIFERNWFQNRRKEEEKRRA